MRDRNATDRGIGVFFVVVVGLVRSRHARKGARTRREKQLFDLELRSNGVANAIANLSRGFEGSRYRGNLRAAELQAQEVETNALERGDSGRKAVRGKGASIAHLGSQVVPYVAIERVPATVEGGKLIVERVDALA